MARKKRLESQQAHHLALNDFIETAENEAVEYFIKRIFEKYKVKGNEWFAMPNFVVALVEIAFDLIKREIESEPSFNQKSELFEILISQLKEIIDEYKGSEEPTKKLILKLQNIYDINSKRKGLLGRKTPKEYIIDQWFISKSKLKNLEHIYVKTHCPYKINDIIEDEYGAKFQVKKRSVYFLDNNQDSFHYEGIQLLKNGRLGKKYHNFIIAKGDRDIVK